MKNLSEKVSAVKDQESMAEFILDLANDYSKNGSDWVNNDLESFLFALSAWVKDMDGYYQNTDQSYDENNVSWKYFADMLMASTMYE